MNERGIPHDRFTDIMLDICPTYTTKEDIMQELWNKYDYITNERQLRKMFEHYNKEYEAHLTDGYFLAHGNKGYKITKIKRAMGEDLHYQDLANEIEEQIKKSTAGTVN